MSAHRAVIETGPGAIRRLCCGIAEVADDEAASSALDFIDDPVALVDEQPVAVGALWRTVLQSLACPHRQPDAVLVVHPSWWSRSRVDLVTAASRTLAGDAAEVATLPRSQLLTAATPGTRTTVIIEIAARLVAITVAATVAEPRVGPAQRVADAVVQRVTALTDGAAAAVLIDGPGSIDGADVLAAMIAERLRTALADTSVELVDDSRLTRHAAAAPRAEPEPPQPASSRDRWPHRIPSLPAALVGLVALVAVGVAALGAGSRERAEVMTTTFLVEGRVALQIPAQWPVRRVTAGPGSTRVEVISPSDPQVVLHVTQSPFPGGSLTVAAESLQHAIQEANAAQPADVFVDFNPAGRRADRPAVTYREVREGHHIDWTVLLDGAVRIGIGCQSRPDDADAVREACEQAVRSAHALS